MRGAGLRDSSRRQKHVIKAVCCTGENSLAPPAPGAARAKPLLLPLMIRSVREAGIDEIWTGKVGSRLGSFVQLTLFTLEDCCVTAVISGNSNSNLIVRR